MDFVVFSNLVYLREFFFLFRAIDYYQKLSFNPVMVLAINISYEIKTADGFATVLEQS